MTQCSCEKLWLGTKGRKRIVAGKQNGKTESGSMFLEKLVGRPYAVSFHPFPPFLQRKKNGDFVDVLPTLAPLSGFLKIANIQDFEF